MSLAGYYSRFPRGYIYVYIYIYKFAYDTFVPFLLFHMILLNMGVFIAKDYGCFKASMSL